MKKAALIIAALTVAACEPLPDNYAGSVVDFNGKLVKIEGVIGSDGKPSKAMLQTAQDLCGSKVRYVGSTLKPGSQTHYTPLGVTYSSGADYITKSYYAFACMKG